MLVGHAKSVSGLAYSPSGNQIFSYSDDSTLRIWDVETGICTHTATGHTKKVFSIAYSPQDDQIASCSGDSTVRVWDVRTGECHHILIGHNGRVFSVTYSPIGHQIASGGGDGLVKMWDLEAGTCLGTLSGHAGEVNKIVYSSSGDVIVSASDDKSVRLWDVVSGQCRAVIQDYKSNVLVMAWIEASDTNYLVAGCGDGSMGMWQVRIAEDHDHVSLCWRPTTGELDLEDANIQDVQGLNHLDRQLLKQRGALGEPVPRLRGASKKLATMASVVSKLGILSSKPAEDSTVTTGVSGEQLGQSLELEKDPLFQDVVASIVKIIHRHK
jgi:WD40 repeat protein